MLSDLDKNIEIHSALVSLSDKTNLLPFIQTLSEFNIKLFSTGGTYHAIKKMGFAVTEVSKYTEFPEIMSGRVKTLHPKIHAGILGRRDIDQEIMQKHGIEAIDMVVVNLYPFMEVVANTDCTFDNAIENIDIGGPSMLRAAAKNHKFVTSISSITDYQIVIDEMRKTNGKISLKTRVNLAQRTYARICQYDLSIANYFKSKSICEDEIIFPDIHQTSYNKKQDLRYGENPHQKAALYTSGEKYTCIANANQVAGKELSFNNIVDADAAFELVKTFIEPACVIVKHANPCGVAHGLNILDAYNKAYKTDPTSAFGGIIAFNRELDVVTTQEIIQSQFVELIITTAIDNKALEIINQTKKNVRILVTGELKHNFNKMFDYKKINSGLLVQESDVNQVKLSDLKIMTNVQPSHQQIQDLIFAFKIAKFVKSNAIVYVKNNQTIGIGAGQMSRVYSAKIAAIKAQDENLEISGSVMASDAFLPFRDSVDQASNLGIGAIIQPGGSIRDNEVIDAANQHKIAMVFTGIRHLRH